MNAGGVDKACKSSGTYFEEVEIISRRRICKFSGERVSNTLVRTLKSEIVHRKVG